MKTYNKENRPCIRCGQNIEAIIEEQDPEFGLILAKDLRLCDVCANHVVEEIKSSGL